MADPATTSVATPSLATLLQGTPFRALARLGRGSMGEVFEAEHINLQRRVVVKLLRREFGADSGMADRLRLEAQATVALDGHPNIVEVLDFGTTASGRPYVVMERLVGRTLARELRARGPLPVDEALALARQILAGLGAAHRAGLIHRDIKPENLFLCNPGIGGERRLKILDFGIVKVVAGRGPAPLARSTEEGATLGTPRYLSPEQARGLALDGRTDLYAVGCVLYWLLTGRDPFHHHTGLFLVLQAHVNERPEPPSTVAQQPIPLAVDHFVIRALAKRPQDRYADAEAMMDALDRLSLASAASSLPAPKRWAETERIDLGAFQAPSFCEEITEEDEDERCVTEPLPCHGGRIAVALPAVDSDAVVLRSARRWAPEMIAIVLSATALGVLAILLYTYLYDLPT